MSVYSVSLYQIKVTKFFPEEHPTIESFAGTSVRKATVVFVSKMSPRPQTFVTSKHLTAFVFEGIQSVVSRTK